MADENKKTTTGQYGKDVSEQFNMDADTLTTKFDILSQKAREVNEIFTQGRQRISELRTALADATPDVARLGGDIGDVSKIIGEVADASRRNVVATGEEVEKLYAANKVLGIGAKELSDSFLDVGIGIESIPKALEESVQYIQSIGGNASSVMKKVQENMEQMNRYQFEGGVQGLTKMAAQASMLRFDMNETFRLSDRVLDPEGAVETAAAFQRLGVAAGNLADPFALMNASINDPGALQDSLVDVAKQFTYFDEKTKTFKINPQGVLTLKEMEKQTGVSAKEMSKLGLAAAEADKRLSEINKAGLTIVNEEDKQYLSNIAKMEGGTYKVTLEDGTKKELSELTQPEFDKLIQQQKEGPKTLEEIARSQMNTSEAMLNDLRAIRAKVVGGLVSARPVQEIYEGTRRGMTALSGAAVRSFETKDVRRESERAIGDLGKLMDDIKNDKISTTDALSNYLERVGKQTGEIEQKFKDAMKKAIEEAKSNTTDKTAIERMMKQGYDYVLDKAESKKTNQQQIRGNMPVSSLIEGRTSRVKDVYNTTNQKSSGSKSQVDVGGTLKIDVNFNGNAGNFTPEQQQQITKAIVDKINSPDFKGVIRESVKPNNPLRSNSINTFGPQ